jgi:hypothetical protein
MKRIAAIVPAAAILILLATACAAPEPVYVMREVTVVATLAPPPGTPAPPEPTALPSGAIAFTSRCDGNYEIYVMNSDGSGQFNLTNDPKTDADPCWSPDGAKIAFTSHRERTTNPEIFVMNADGSGQTNLTQSPGADQQPDWSPDGSRIAFSSERDGNWEIYMMNADGSGQTNLTHQRTWELSPSWSPDSHTIAFSSSRGCAEDKVESCVVYEIYTIQDDGSTLTQLTETGFRDLSPAWSPDGSRIAFVSERDGNAEIYVMDSDGSDQTRLTDDLGADVSPAWSPDGRYIVFSSDRSGNQEIYVMRADGSGVSRLTDSADSDGWPAWTWASAPVPQPTHAPVVPTPPTVPQESNPYDLTRLGQWADDGYLVYFQIDAANTSEAEAFRQAGFEYVTGEFAAFPNLGIVAPEDLQSINRQLMDCLGLNSSDLSLFILPMPTSVNAALISEAVRFRAKPELKARWEAKPMAGHDCVPQSGSEFQWLVLTYKGDPGSSADDFVGVVIQRVVELVPQFQIVSYAPELLRSVHDFGITYCFPPNPGEFNVAIRFKPEMTLMRRFGIQGNDFHNILLTLGVAYGLQLERWEYVPGEQCVVRK